MKGQAQHLGAAAPSERNAQPFSADAIEPARRQFIERLLAELGFDGGCSPRSELIAFVHRRLFLEKAPIEAIRVELRQRTRLARVVAVSSGKGGVGKTTVSVNLAVALANSGHRVLLFDADFGMANVHVFSGIAPRTTLLDVLDGRRRLDDAVVTGPAGIHVICGASGIGRLADLGASEREALGREVLRVAEGYDVLLLDTGAGISPAVTQFLGMADDILIVTTPNIAATLDAYGLIKVAHESLFRARLNLLVNLAEDETQARVVHERISGCATRFLQRSVSFRGCLLRDAGVEQANQSRMPFVQQNPGHFNSQQFARIADHFRPAAVMAQTAAA